MKEDLLSPQDRQLLIHEAATAEQTGRLTPAQLEVVYRHNWFNLFVPKALGGLELTLPEALLLEETLAEIDGSLGWTVTLCAGAAWFVGFLNPDLAQEVFSDPKACLGGSGAATGMAKKEGGGYRVSGQWRFATGAPHLTHFTANAQMVDADGTPLLNPDGAPQTAAFLFRKEEVAELSDWRAMGLIATASHSFKVSDVWVPQDRLFHIDPQSAILSGPLFQYPFLPFAAATLAVNYYGMASHFLKLAGQLFASKNKPALLDLHHTVAAELSALRQTLYETVAITWERVREGAALSEAEAGIVNRAGARLAEAAIRQVDLLFPYCGMTGADTATPINRVWRDLHTASQHGLLRQLL